MNSSSRANQNPDTGSQRNVESSRPRNPRARSSVYARLRRIPHAVGENYRLLLNNLGWRPGSHGLKIVALTSCRPGEGVSTVAVQLGVCAAATPGNILLIDCNEQNPKLHLTFRLKATLGFPEFLQNSNTLDTVHATGVSGLSVIPFGNRPLPSVSHDKFEQALESACLEYDLVVLDLPSISESPLTVHWARSLNNLLLVVSKRIPTALAANGKRILENGGGVVSGIIENQN